MRLAGTYFEQAAAHFVHTMPKTCFLTVAEIARLLFKLDKPVTSARLLYGLQSTSEDEAFITNMQLFDPFPFKRYAMIQSLVRASFDKPSVETTWSPGKSATLDEVTALALAELSTVNA